MMPKLARAGVAAVLVLLMAGTPLSALIAPGQFEVRFRSVDAWDSGLTVRLDDRTGLAKGLAIAAEPAGLHDAVTDYGFNGRMLIVTLDGSSCDYLTQLVLDRTGSGFVILEMTEDSGCSIGTGMGRAVAISLWTSIDASTVAFVSVN